MSSTARTSSASAFAPARAPAYFGLATVVELLDRNREALGADQPYWRDGGVVRPAFDKVRKGDKTSWCDFTTCVDGVEFPKCLVSYAKHVLSGQIDPSTPEGLAELQAQKGPLYQGKVREQKPTTMMRLYGNAQLKTVPDDEFTFDTNADGSECRPPPEAMQLVPRFADHLNNVLAFEAGGRVLAGQVLAKQAKTKEGAELVAAVAAKVEKEFPGFDFQNRVGEIIVLASELAAWPAAAKAAANRPISVPSTKIVEIVQRTIRGGKHVGRPLLNPIMRAGIPLNDATGLLKTPAYDLTKAFRNKAGGLDFEPVRVDGKEVHADNLHKVFVSGAVLTGVMEFSICFSQMGISGPVSLLHTLISPPPKRAGGRSLEAYLSALSPEMLAELEAGAADAAADAADAAETDAPAGAGCASSPEPASGGGAGAAAGASDPVDTAAFDDELLSALGGGV